MHDKARVEVQFKGLKPIRGRVERLLTETSCLVVVEDDPNENGRAPGSKLVVHRALVTVLGGDAA